MAKKPVAKKGREPAKAPKPTSKKQAASVPADVEALFNDVKKPVASGEVAKLLTQAVEKSLELEQTIDSLEEAAKGYKSELRQLLERTIPELMASIQSMEWKHEKTGAKVAVKDMILGSLPKEEEPRKTAIEWLTTHDGQDLIKSNIAMSFGKGDHNFMKEVEAKLDKLKAQYTIKEDVHAQSLALFARQRLENGEECPLDVLGLYSIRQAKITLPRKSKGKE